MRVEFVRRAVAIDPDFSMMMPHCHLRIARNTRFWGTGAPAPDLVTVEACRLVCSFGATVCADAAVFAGCLLRADLH